MRFLRHRRRRIGSTLAAVFLLIAVVPGIVAAAEGVRLQAHICSPDGAQAPADGLPQFVADGHCQLCPAGFVPVPVIAVDGDIPFVYAILRNGSFPAVSDGRHIRRIELSPLNGRAPPLQG